ncbi:enoyl-CoA hydratase/isomerase family protein [Niveispirillum sp.]|uniref:enoyl-CoA hydratase/isomerase family protein n=1 Tax=Niveispirillum sp. TaxID=1917217 RepID=UPI001B5D5864|nr:enoyl-CoA hydratase/isomerase family protein [Niveispirillum sp.]MBP7334969.1 enoyl-CoA hydratase/isomerase family protein [Niveispirillum sp.]
MSDPATDPIILEQHGAIALVRLNLPAKRNALVPALVAALTSILDRIAADRTIRAVVLTGAGGAFCAGGDLGGMEASDPLGGTAMMRSCQGIVRRIATLPQPVVAAVEGAAFGAGFSIALACDLVVVGPGSRFCAAFGKVGLMPDLGLLWSLPQRVPLGRARELLMLCDVVGGEAAVAEHIADVLVPDAEILATALTRARRLADAAPGAVTAIKRVLAAWPQGLDDVLRAEEVGQSLLIATADHGAARTAFFEKRPVDFEGR